MILNLKNICNNNFVIVNILAFTNYFQIRILVLDVFNCINLILHVHTIMLTFY